MVKIGYKTKSKTKRGRSQDRNRISLTSRHEVYYLRRKCTEFIKIIDGELEKEMSTQTLKRICRAFLLYSKNKSKPYRREK